MEEKRDKLEIKLVLAAKSGELSAFNDLVRRHQKGVKAVAFSFLGRAHDADDVTQEAFLRAFQKLDTLRPPFNFGAWVRQIADCLHLLRIYNYLNRRHGIIFVFKLFPLQLLIPG